MTTKTEKIILENEIIVNVWTDESEDPRQLIFCGVLREDRANEAIARINA